MLDQLELKRNEENGDITRLLLKRENKEALELNFVRSWFLLLKGHMRHVKGSKR